MGRVRGIHIKKESSFFHEKAIIRKKKGGTKDDGKKNEKGKNKTPNVDKEDMNPVRKTLKALFVFILFFLFEFCFIRLLLATSLLGGLGDLAGTLVLLVDGLDDTDSNGLTHVTDGETT